MVRRLVMDLDLEVASDYLSAYFVPERREQIVEQAKITLHKVKFDIIAVRGVSGLLWGTLLADRLGKRLVVIRKEDGHHSSKSVEGVLPGPNKKQWIIVDDFISTGNTVKIIYEAVNYPKGFVGFYSASYNHFCCNEELKTRGWWKDL